MPGDELVELDGRDVRAWPLQDVLDYLIRDEPLAVNVTLRRGGKALGVQIVRARFSDIGAGAGVRYELSSDSTRYKAVPLVEPPAAVHGDSVVLQGLYGRDCGKAELRVGNGQYRFLYFWASWCGPCKVFMRRIAAERGHVTSPELIGINVDDECETFRAAADSIRPPGEQYWAGGYHADLPQVLRIYRRGIPTAIVLDPESRLLAVAVGIDSALALYSRPNPK
jgi:thiol-disulfide isomerase/thioredoxin